MMKLSSWGNYPVTEARLSQPNQRELIGHMTETESVTPRGLGRSYGDAALGDYVIDSSNLNHCLSFDRDLGIFSCESGVSFEEILQIITPEGWFLPVTPGTKFVTLGGAIAADVHGKNHHKDGTFCDHLLSLSILLGTGAILRCSPTENTELFRATCGGMGLTGIILSATFKLKKINSVYIKEERFKCPNLGSLFQALEDADDWTYSVAWIDCIAKGANLGRGILMRGEHASADEAPKSSLAYPNSKAKTIPFNFPSWALNTLSMRLFNVLYYHKQRRAKDSVISSMETFFYPLDAVYHWNRIYGKRGFVQYQFVLPTETAYEGMRLILEKISAFGQASFLAVLKKFGPENENYLSFPKAGYTLALDFPVTNSIFNFLDELDQDVLRFGGRIYLAKDARLTKLTLEKMIDTKKFNEVRDRYRGKTMFTSDLAERVGLV